MSANLSLPVSVNEWLRTATAQLTKRAIPTARLDALVLLQDALQRDKSWLLAHPEHIISPDQQRELAEKLALRLNHMPLAYIRGERDFYGRPFAVTNNVLIPRQETETLIELLLALPKNPHDTFVDVGTGSGIIAITAKLECPALDVYAVDISQAALAIARQNAQHHKAQVSFAQGDLLNESQRSFHFIAANLPYVATTWEVSPETAFEPVEALYAADHGLALIKTLLWQGTERLYPKGFLLLEADPRQHPVITNDAQALGYRLYQQRDFILVLRLQ